MKASANLDQHDCLNLADLNNLRRPSRSYAGNSKSYDDFPD